jgi:hypothetical protein
VRGWRWRAVVQLVVLVGAACLLLAVVNALAGRPVW